MITPDFSAYAVKAELRSLPHAGGPEVGARVEDLLSKIATECSEAGAYLIGHIKCVVETPGKGFMAVSVVDPRTPPTSRGELGDGITDADVVINVLLYGLTKEKVRGIVDPLAQKELAFPGAQVRLRDLEQPANMVHFREHAPGEGRRH